MAALLRQVTTSHGDVAPEPDGSTGLLQVSLQGTPHRAAGTVQGSTPVLREINGATFKQPAPLAGPILIYRAKASEPNTLPALAGELPASHPKQGGQPGGTPYLPQSRAPAAAGRGRCCMERQGWTGEFGQGVGGLEERTWGRGKKRHREAFEGRWGRQSPATRRVLGQWGSLQPLTPLLLSRAAGEGGGPAPVLPQLRHGGRGAVERRGALGPPV